MAKPRFHPVTEIFPDMPPAEYAALKADVEENGLLIPIWRLSDGRIVDGRHRQMVCDELKIEPEYEEVPDCEGRELLRLVVALNLKRRHLDESQRAMVTARLANLADGQRKGGAQICAPITQPEAAEMLNVSRRLAQHARKVQERGTPELVAAVDAGEIAVSDAAIAAKKSKREQTTILKRVQSGTARNVKDAVRKISLAKQIELVNKTPPPRGKFNVIAVDPPWQFEKTRENDPTQRGRTPYPTMTVDEICDLKIPADTDCVLFLWTTNAHFADGSAARVLARWGFNGKTILTWAKPKMGLGDWLRGKTEHCIVASKGVPVHGRPGSDTTLLEAPVGEHSEKPDAFYDLVERLCPGKKLEMFARKQRKGWSAHGAERKGAIK